MSILTMMLGALLIVWALSTAGLLIAVMLIWTRDMLARLQTPRQHHDPVPRGSE